MIPDWLLWGTILGLTGGVLVNLYLQARERAAVDKAVRAKVMRQIKEFPPFGFIPLTGPVWSRDTGRMKTTEQALAPVFAGRSTMPSGLVEAVERLLQSRADTAFLVGVNYGRTSERERIEMESHAGS